MTTKIKADSRSTTCLHIMLGYTYPKDMSKISMKDEHKQIQVIIYTLCHIEGSRKITSRAHRM
jgi:hypothetical protein